METLKNGLTDNKQVEGETRLKSAIKTNKQIEGETRLGSAIEKPNGRKQKQK